MNRKYIPDLGTMLKLKELVSLLSSQKIAWLIAVVIFVLYLSLTNSLKSLEKRIDEVNNNELLRVESSDLANRLEEIESSIKIIKEEVCSSISSLFELNDKVYICPLAFR